MTEIAWAEALLDGGGAPLLERETASCRTGFVAGTAVCLLVDEGPDASGPGAGGAVVDRAIDFATRTGCALVHVVVDGGSATASQLRALHRLSGVVPCVAVETGARSEAGRLRAAAADWRCAVTTEPETDAPHFGGDDDAARWVRSLLSLLPANNTLPAPADAPASTETPAAARRTGSLDALDPASLVARIADETPVRVGPSESGLETGFARLGGRTVGCAASTVSTGDGELSARDLAAAARLVAYCDAYHLPLVIALDTPGLAPGTALASANSLVRALSEAATPTAVLVVRRADGRIGELLTDRTLITGEVLAWAGATDRGGPAIDADRVIAPDDTVRELLVTLERWAAVDEPLPERRGTVPAR